jgi:N-formylglutamate deformylase
VSTFRLELPQQDRIPILLSIPHCGTKIPDDLIPEFDSGQISGMDDTDWFVDRLYSFAPKMGITVLSAEVSRWVIDLNRDPQDKPLYNDGRVITGLCPVTDFLGMPIYKDKRERVSATEIERRKVHYYHPYHQELRRQLDSLLSEFGIALLWECHSIRQLVPSISQKPFPDLILGDAGGTSASPGLIEAALNTLEHSAYSVKHNYPFMGGHITRFFGKPSQNVHAIQLEMSKINYMDDSETQWHEERASKMQGLLRETFNSLSAVLSGHKKD